MDFDKIKQGVLSTPSFVFDENTLRINLATLADLKKQSGCHVLYSMKALPLQHVLKLTSHFLDGLSVSSLFEARLANEVLFGSGSIHITTPGLKDSEFSEISKLCSHISFNSTSQSHRLKNNPITSSSLGLRINPNLSFASDPRFDPCRPHSKLGISLDSINAIPNEIEGLHFHTVFSNTHYHSLEQTFQLLEQKLSSQFNQLKWINLGGGYLYSQINNHQPFINLVKKIRTKYHLEVFIEPGKTVVGNAGVLVSSVIDSFESNGKNILVLDTSVNHNPEVFEYQKSPQLLNANKQGKYSYHIVGSSCLAGDIFGDYLFNHSLKVGDKLIFLDIGAYSLIKANRFNGYNLPDVYWLDKDNNLSLIKQSNYQDYRQQW